MAISFVQASQQSNGGGAVATVVLGSATYGNNTSLDIALYCYKPVGGAPAFTFTDSSFGVAGQIGGQVPVKKGSTINPTADDYIEHWIVENISGFTGTITATFNNGNAEYGSILVSTLSSNTTSPAYDSGNVASQASPGTGTNAITISATAAAASGLILGFSNNFVASSRIPAVGTGFTDRGDFWNFGGGAQTSKLESAAYSGTGSKAATWTSFTGGGSDTYVNFITLWTDAAGGGSVFIPIIGRGPGMALVGNSGLVS